MTSPADLAPAHLTYGEKRRSSVELAREGISDVLRRRRLIGYLVNAALRRTHADTVLGQAWWLLDPFLQMLVYYFVFAIVFQRKIEDFLLFLFAAILPWKWFSTTINASMGAVVNQQGLIRQVQFPKIVLPVSIVVAETVSFLVGLIALAILYVPYFHRLSPWVVMIIPIAAVQLLFTFAVAIFVSYANAFYRDVANIMGHGLKLWWYMSPGLYALSEITDDRLRMVLSLNPFSVLFNAYRLVIWGTATHTRGTAPDFVSLAILAAVSVVLILLSVISFKRVEPAFARIL